MRFPPSGRVSCAPAVAIGEEVAGVVEHDVLHQIHAAPMQAARERAVVVQRAQVAVDLHEVFGPVAVVAGVLPARVQPLVGHGRRDPQRGGAQALHVVQALRQAAQVTAVVALGVAGGVLARALVVVAGVAVGKPIGHHEVDDLVAPVG
jgi:hypothetical protein